MPQRRDLFKGLCATAAAPVLGSLATQAMAMPRQDKCSLSAIHLTALIELRLQKRNFDPHF